MSASRIILYLILLTACIAMPPPLTAALNSDVPQRIWHFTEASGQAAGEAWGTQVVSDTSGAVYVSGFQTSTPFGTALLLQKYSSTGRLLWSRSHPGYPGDFLPRACLLTPRQQIVLAATTSHPDSALRLFWYDPEGVLLNEVRCGGIAGSVPARVSMIADRFSQIHLALTVQDDIILLRYSPSAELLWQHREDGAGEYLCDAIGMDSTGALYAAGIKYQPTQNLFVWKFDTSGTLQWRSSYNEPGSYTPPQMTVYPQGGCCILTSSNPPESYKNDLLTLSFTAEGRLVWSARHETGLETGIQGILARDDSGRLYVAGRQATDGDSTAIVLICYANDGKKLWQTGYTRGWLNINAIHTLALGRPDGLYLASTTEDWQEHRQLLICRFDPSGVLAWDSFFPALSEESFEAEGAAMAVTGDGRCIIAGEQRDAITANDRLLVLGLDSAGKSSWQANAGGEMTSRDLWIDYQVDASGCLYLLGRSMGSMEGEISSTFLAVLKPDGALLWRLPLAGLEAGNAALQFLSVDRGGAAYAGGTGKDKQGRDLFVIVRISAGGQLLWSKTATAVEQYSCTIADQALDQQGNLVVTGSFYRTPAAADPGGDVYTFKLDPGGRLIWQAVYSGDAPSDDHPIALAIDASGHACVATVGKNREILRYDPDGKLLWRAGYNRSATSYDRPEQLAIDPEQNIWLWSYTSDLQAGVRRQGVLAKFSPAGKRLWQTNEGDPLGFVRTILLSVDSRGRATAAGYYWEGPEAQHYFVTRIDEEGKVLWRTVTGSRMLLDGLVDRQGCTWLLTEAGAGRREVLGLDDQGGLLGAWPVTEASASRMLGDINGRFYFAANQLGYGWSAFDLSCYAPTTAAAITIPRPAMLQNYPNPFNISTTIRYAVQTAGRVRITIHDRLGRQVAQPVDAPHTTGWHEIIWNSTRASGLYFIRLQSDEGTTWEKMLLLRR